MLCCVLRYPVLLLSCAVAVLCCCCPVPAVLRLCYAVLCHQPENVFLTNSSTGDVDWEGVRLGDFGSAVEVALAGKTTLSGLQTRWVAGEKEEIVFFSS